MVPSLSHHLFLSARGCLLLCSWLLAALGCLLLGAIYAWMLAALAACCLLLVSAFDSSQRRRLAMRLERLGVEAPPQRLGTPRRL
jgi:hypothetical protein